MEIMFEILTLDSIKILNININRVYSSKLKNYYNFSLKIRIVDVAIIITQTKRNHIFQGAQLV